MTTSPLCAADHAHGEKPTCYLRHGCRCTQCRAGQARRQADRRRAIAYGTYRPRVGATAAREHLEQLRATGMGVRTIAVRTGIPYTNLSDIVWGSAHRDGIRRRREHISADLEARILAVQPRFDDIADGASIDGRGTRRRLQALACMGWSGAALSRRLGIREYRLARITHAPRVLASTARVVAALYAELWAQRPTATTATGRDAIARTIARARAAGWVPPLGWDDIDEDDSPATAPTTSEPDVIAIELAVTGAARVTLTTAERHEAVRTLNARGYWDTDIARMLSVDEKTIARDREALHLPAIDNLTHANRAAQKALAA